MLKILLISALIALGAFALAVVGLSVWRSFEQQQQANAADSNTAAENEANNVTATQRTEKAIARYNLWPAIFTGLLAFIGLIQIGFLISADTTAANSANAAKQSAEAAKQSVEVAQQALVAGQRAFVSVNEYRKIARLKIDTGELVEWGFSVIWLNAGNTPTRNMINHVNLKLLDHELPADWSFPDQWGPGEHKPTPLGIAPKGTVESDALYLTVADIDDVIHDKKFLYFWGWASYDDVFPRTPKHVTRFAVQVVIGGDAKTQDRISFRFNYLPRYNCSDEECERAGYPASWTPPEATQ